MICIIALVVFGILGIFSATHRQVFFEACDCVFRRVTLRKCKTGLDKRLKGQVTGSIMRFSPKTAGFVFKYFEVFSWLFLILMVVSIYYTADGTYNYIIYGNCNGPGSTEFCIFDPFAQSAEEQVSTCHENIGDAKDSVLIPPKDLTGMKRFGNPDSGVTFIHFGCYTCEFTKKAQTDVTKILEEFLDQINYVYIDYPLPTHELSFEASMAANCIYNQSKEAYLKYSDMIFSEEEPITKEDLYTYASQLDIDQEEFDVCLTTQSTSEIVAENQAIGQAIGVYGTPTFFINEKALVGPQPYKPFRKLIKDELNK